MVETIEDHVAPEQGHDAPRVDPPLAEWNDTAREYPRDTCVHQLVQEQARRTPDTVAVCFQDQSLTYGELNRKSNQLAQHLRQLGVGPDVLVGLCVERSLEMIVGLLGILKAGGAYVPMDPAYPAERLAFMMEDARAAVLLTQHRLLDQLPQHNAQVVCLDSDWGRIEKLPSDSPTVNVSAEHLAYVIYTSGSTGKPKGVQVLHRGVVNLLLSMQREPGLSSDDVLLAVTTICFDIAGLEMFLPLISGARIELVSRQVAQDGRRLIGAIAASGATMLQATPATWRLLLAAGWEGNAGLKILCGGEAMPADLADHLLRRAESVWNVYGPTETTIWSTAARVGPGTGAVPIGHPIANTQIYLLDSHMQPVPIGVDGELFIGGDGVARGYLNRPELTAQKFLPDPFSTRIGAKMYRTGDLARYRPDGAIDFLGRIDHQVKIRGYRIELGDIEAALAQHPAVRQNVCIAREDTPGDKRLVAYLVLGDENRPVAEDLRRFLKGKLPDYMVPSAFVLLQFLPLTPNGKVDRNALPVPVPGPALLGGGREFVEPSTAIERILVGMWAEAFRMERISIHDNFFDLGGHSLLAVQLAAKIEKAFGRALPLSTFFEAATVQRMAEVLASEPATDDSPSLIGLQPEGSAPPFFCLPGAGGHAVSFWRLAQLMGSDQPFYGLQSRGLDGRQEVHRSIEEMAAYLIEKMREAQASGPYHLGGYSLGGLIAYEMAQQLQSQGERVALLVMLDADAPGYPKVAPLGARIGLHCKEFLKLDLGGKLRYMGGRFKAIARRLSWRKRMPISSSLPNEGDSLSLAITQFETTVIMASQKYAPKPYPGPVTVLRASDMPQWLGTSYDDETMGWGQFVTGDVQMHSISGHHLAIFEPPHVQRLAEVLGACLRNSRREPGAALEEGCAVSTDAAIACDVSKQPALAAD